MGLDAPPIIIFTYREQSGSTRIKKNTNKDLKSGLKGLCQVSQQQKDHWACTTASKDEASNQLAIECGVPFPTRTTWAALAFSVAILSSYLRQRLNCDRHKAAPKTPPAPHTCLDPLRSLTPSHSLTLPPSLPPLISTEKSHSTRSSAETAGHTSFPFPFTNLHDTHTHKNKPPSTLHSHTHTHTHTQTSFM